MLFDPLDAILSSPNKVRVLRALIPLKGGVSGREVARLAGVSRAAMGALDELVDMGVVVRREATGQHLYSFNRHSYFAPPLSSLFQSEEARVQEVFTVLRNSIVPDLVLSLFIFGSAARGEAGPQSDFDVLAVVESGNRVEPAYEALSEISEPMREQFGLRLSPVVLTLTDLEKRHTEGDPFVHSALADVVHVHGIPPHELVHGAAG